MCNKSHWGWRSENGQFVFSLSDKPSAPSHESLAAQHTQIIYVAVALRRCADGELTYTYKIKDCPFPSQCCEIREHYAACHEHRRFFLVYLTLHGTKLTDNEFDELMADVQKSVM